tara:strand:- start:3953 stop:4213 length:261 start_codon:yes stop_codon:yes gene_type:complete
MSKVMSDGVKMTPEDVKKRRMLLKFLEGATIDHADCFASGEVFLQISKGGRQYLISFMNNGPKANYQLLGLPEEEFWPKDSPPKKE